MRVGRRSVIVVSVASAHALFACSILTDYSLDAGSAAPEDEAGANADGAIDAAAGDAATDLDAAVTCSEKPCIVELAAAGMATCARTDDGAVYCWGRNSTGVIGAAVKGDYPKPAKVPFDGPVDEITVGDWGREQPTACARRGAIIECWGRDEWRQLGRGGPTSAGMFVPVPAPVVGAVGGATSVAMGSEIGCIVVDDGGLSCWGKTYDAVIHPSAEPFASPRPVKKLVSGRWHSCAILDTEEVACAGYLYGFRENWGDGGTGPGQPSLTIVPGVTGVVRLASSGNFACAVKKGGAVVCWGRNKRGQLGRGTTEKQSEVPAPVALPGAAKLVATGLSHACALLDDGSVWCWGANGGGTTAYNGNKHVPRGQVGALPDGGVDLTSPTPRKVEGMPEGTVRSLVGGYDHTCALLTNGAVHCWGGNAHGQLGLGKSAPNTDGGVDEQPHPRPSRVVF